MKKILISLMFVLLLCGSVVAQDEVKPLSLGLDTLQGDIVYLPKIGALATGAGVTFAKIYGGLADMRIQYAYVLTEEVDRNLVGVTVGIDVVKVIEKLKGEWILKGIAPSLGAGVLIDMADTNSKDAIQPAIYLSVVKVEF